MFETHGYPLESHQVQTEDGYILTLFRIPGCKTDSNCGKDEDGLKKPETKKPAVLLVHGLLGAGDCWFGNSPEKALPYILADEGFDVWIANCRGTPLSQAHISLPTSSRKYWDFSFHEIGLFDVPAMIDYILDTTGTDSLFYIGHSLGCTAFFIALSAKVKYCSKVTAMVAIAPAVYFKHFRNRWIRTILPFQLMTGTLRCLYRKKMPLKSVMGMANTICPPFRSKEKVASWFTKTVGPKLGIYTRDQIEKPRLAALASIFPMTTSMKVFGHGSQCYYSGKFKQFDYGRSGNMKKYDQRKPPIYDLKKIEVPVVTFYSEFDELCTPKDVTRVAQELPNVIGHNGICQPRLGHVDLILGKDAAEVVFKKIILVFRTSVSLVSVKEL